MPVSDLDWGEWDSIILSNILSSSLCPVFIPHTVHSSVSSSYSPPCFVSLFYSCHVITFHRTLVAVSWDPPWFILSLLILHLYLSVHLHTLPPFVSSVHPDGNVLCIISYTCNRPQLLSRMQCSSQKTDNPCSPLRVVLIRAQGSGLGWGNDQSILLNCNQSRVWPKMETVTDMETQSLSGWGALSPEGLSLCVWESYKFLPTFSALIPECDPTTPDLDTSQHPSCGSLSDLDSPHREPKPPLCPPPNSTPYV